MAIWGIPFNKIRVRNEGASSPEEFKDWILKHGDNFLHGIANPQNGDLLVFSWMKKPGEWVFVGDAIVKQNHMSGSVDWCDCTTDDKIDYERHIFTGGYRSYPTAVNSKQIPSIKPRAFATISSENYFDIIKKSVEHWED